MGCLYLMQIHQTVSFIFIHSTCDEHKEPLQTLISVFRDNVKYIDYVHITTQGDVL